MPSYTIKRSQSVDVSAERAIQAVSDFGTWRTWSPWLLVDPDAILTISEPANEVGSTYQWNGGVCGEGQLTQLDATLGEHVRCELKFLRPMKSVCETDFTAAANFGRSM